MTKNEFDVMFMFHKEPQIETDVIARKNGVSNAEIDRIVSGLEEKGYLNSGHVTKDGYDALAPYKVDNAIIMAAGKSSRCQPLSKIVPKGLFEIKGEVLLERQILQLQESGISNIIVVVGYLKEKFMYLKDKLNIEIVENKDWNVRNNTSTLFAVQEKLGNSYICCSDNYFTVNVFQDYVYDSYYGCRYSENYVDEYCISKMSGDYIAGIRRGGEKTWYTIGEAYFNRAFSKRFLELLNAEYDYSDVKSMLWDDFHIKHVDELKLRKREYDDKAVKEFDTLDEALEFDSNFRYFIDKYLGKGSVAERSADRWFAEYEQITRYNVVPTEQKDGRLHVNENLFTPSPKCLEALKDITIEDLYQYDLVKDDSLEVELSSYLNVPKDNIFVHNGSAEILRLILSLTVSKNDIVMLPSPGWNYYKSILDVKFAKCEYFNIPSGSDSYYFDMNDILTKAKRFDPKVIVITTPNNPTGNLIAQKDLEKILLANPNTLVLVDEAYWGYSDVELDINYLLKAYANVVFVRTLSKFFGLASVRMGYCLCSAHAKAMFNLDMPLFRTPVVSRKIAIAALRDKAYYDVMKKDAIEIRTWFCNELNKIKGIRALPSAANFVFVDLDGYDVNKMKSYIASQGILVRLFPVNNRISMRITIAPKTILEKTLQAFKDSCVECKE